MSKMPYVTILKTNLLGSSFPSVGQYLHGPCTKLQVPSRTHSRDREWVKRFKRGSLLAASQSHNIMSKSCTCITAGVTTVGPLLTAVANVCPATSDWVTMMPAMLMPRASATDVTAVELAMAAVVDLTMPALCYTLCEPFSSTQFSKYRSHYYCYCCCCCYFYLQCHHLDQNKISKIFPMKDYYYYYYYYYYSDWQFLSFTCKTFKLFTKLIFIQKLILKKLILINNILH